MTGTTLSSHVAPAEKGGRRLAHLQGWRHVSDEGSWLRPSHLPLLLPGYAGSRVRRMRWSLGVASYRGMSKGSETGVCIPVFIIYQLCDFSKPPLPHGQNGLGSGPP